MGYSHLTDCGVMMYCRGSNADWELEVSIFTTPSVPCEKSKSLGSEAESDGKAPPGE